jgi:hypothetical protein
MDSVFLPSGHVLDAEEDSSLLVGPALAIGPTALGPSGLEDGALGILETVQSHYPPGSALEPVTET